MHPVRPHLHSQSDSDDDYDSGLDASESDEQPENIPEPGPPIFSPSMMEVLKVRYLLQWKLTTGLPEELIDLIIDAADYWPSAEYTLKEKRIIHKDRDQVLLKTVPLCYDRQSLEHGSSPKTVPHRGSHPCRKIVFKLSSHDQGGGRRRPDMYRYSWTWFDTEVIHGAHQKRMYVDGIEQEVLEDERGQVASHYTEADALLLPRDNKLQVNGAHVSEMQHVTIVWDHRDDVKADSPKAREIEETQGRGTITLDGQGVRELEIGDSIALWARARFPGWSNHVEHASVRIYWAV